jgi:DNA-directed RNA polymerase, mitochondrial
LSLITLAASARFAGIDVSEFELTNEWRMHLGTACLNLFTTTTGYVEIDRQTLRNKKEVFIVPTEQTLKWIEACNEAFETLDPVFLPTIDKPRPWSTPEDGGYHDALAGALKLVRSKGPKRETFHDINDRDIPVVYRAVNALQDTAWRINERVLNIVEIVKQWQQHRLPKSIASFDNEPEPKKPHDIETNEDARRVWRAAARAVHDRNYRRRRKAIRLANTIATAKRLHEEPRFFFPFNLDFRGRAYPVPVYRQPQGDDLQKGLLMFADGKPLGTQEAANWLAIHGANCLSNAPNGQKLDKLRFQDRIGWMQGHSEMFCEIADDPISHHKLWLSADSPFCYLAFCFEWADYVRNGLAHVSHLPIAMDGSCNGLQHFSALLRDEEGGRAVNLVPSETPQDIYKAVANRVTDRLRQLVTSSVDTEEGRLALDWLKWGRVDRRLVKRQVMTLPYGANEYVFRQQTAGFLSELEDSDEAPEFMTDTPDNGRRHCSFIAAVIWESVGDTVVSAKEAMDWFRQLARLAVNSGMPICWTSPVGFPVVQPYYKSTLKQVETTFDGIRFKPSVYTPTTDIDPKQQISGISPNIIHSLDAAAMMLTVCASIDEGITHFAMVHDSYGTHAADAERLARITREQFVNMYTAHDVLADIEDSVLMYAEMCVDYEDGGEPVERPPRPKVGTLDLTQVIDSKYFFA